MAKHEYPYLDKPERLEFPTETWAAQDIRKAVVLDLAAEHSVDVAERARFTERAEFFHRTALATLSRQPTHSTTRPVVLLLTNGFTRAWHRMRGHERPAASTAHDPWPPRTPFVPQRQLATQRLAWIAGGGVAAVALLALLAVLVA